MLHNLYYSNNINYVTVMREGIVPIFLNTCLCLNFIVFGFN